MRARNAACDLASGCALGAVSDELRALGVVVALGRMRIRAARALRLAFFASIVCRLCASVPIFATVCVVALGGRGRGLGLGRLECALVCCGHTYLIRLCLGLWSLVVGSGHGTSPKHL